MSGVTVDDRRLQISVIGPLRVRDQWGADVTPDGGLQRRLLALLVLRRGEVVSRDTAVDVLWPATPPADPSAALQNHVSRLRALLPDGLIRSVGSGYLLDAELVRVDVDEVAESIAAEMGPGARGRLAELLDRWAGAPYPELADSDVVHHEEARLAELRVGAEEALAEALIAAGDTDRIIARLTALIADEPLRERPRALLMAALGSQGRIVEALRAFDDFRRLLGDELGIEPSAALTAQHVALLGGLSTSFVDATMSRVPSPTTTLIGRDALIENVLASVTSHRVVTLVGPGGVGKTRLMTEVGRRLITGREHPVVFCDLSQADISSVADVVASSLGIDARFGVPAVQRVVEMLEPVEMVLLFDNCEHVVESAADVIERIVRSCPLVSIVSTSRERLRVSGEHVRVVPTLLADDGESAVALFVDRAQDVRADFAPTGAERESIDEIVRRLDGLPLAIELAAARLHTHDVAEVAAGLGDPLALLSSGFRTSSRHSSLEAVIEWSHGLLDDGLRLLFDALSVFRRSFTAVDAAAVADIDAATAVSMLSQLVERSLVSRTDNRRYQMFETLRAFGAARLVEAGRSDGIAERHARWMLEWAEDVERRLDLTGERAIVEVDDAVTELRLAIDWLLDHDLLEHAARMIAALLNYALLRLRADVLEWSHLVLDAGLADDRPVAPKIWTAAAYGSWMKGDVTEAGRLVSCAVDIAERGSGLSQQVATMRGNFDLFEGRLDDAAHWYRIAVEVSEVPTQHLIASGTLMLALGYSGDDSAHDLGEELLRQVADDVTAPAAYIWYCVGEADLSVDVDRARRRLTRAIELAEITNASLARGVAGASRASIEARIGDPMAAATDYLWLIPHWRRASMWSTQWTMLRSIVVLLERLGSHHDAAVIEGAVVGTAVGHRIFGDDERQLHDIGLRLREELGDADYEAAREEGARFDGNAAVDRAMSAISQAIGGTRGVPLR